MKIGILGTVEVGNLIGARLIKIGHHVMMGGRKPNNEKGLAFVKNNPENASYGTFAEAASFGEVIFNAINEKFVLEALSWHTQILPQKLLLMFLTRWTYLQNHKTYFLNLPAPIQLENPFKGITQKRLGLKRLIHWRWP